MEELAAKVKTSFEAYETEMAKFIGGNNAAGGRARKALAELRKIAQELRFAIQDKKNKDKEAKAKK